MRRLTLALPLVCLILAAGAAAQTQPATITGPIAVTVPLGDPSHDFVFSTSAIDLAGHGYVEEEFFIEEPPAGIRRRSWPRAALSTAAIPVRLASWCDAQPHPIASTARSWSSGTT